MGLNREGDSVGKVLSKEEVEELEITLIRTMMQDYQTQFNARLEAIQHKQEASAADTLDEAELGRQIEDLQNFVNSNKDLKEALGGEIQELKNNYEKLEGMVEDINKGMAELNIRMDVIEDKPLPGKNHV